MTRGKYAERAKTKQAADAATVAALREVNALKARVRTLEHLELENARLRMTLKDARTELDQQRELNERGASDEVLRLENLNAVLHETILEWQTLSTEIIANKKAEIDAITSLLLGIPRSPTMWGILQQYYLIIVRDGPTKDRWRRMSSQQFRDDLLKASQPRPTNDSDENFAKRNDELIQRYRDRIEAYKAEKGLTA